MAHRRPPRRGYYDRPARPSAAGSAFVFTLGILLLLVALAGGYILSWRAGMVSVGDLPLLGLVDNKQVCADVAQHNTDYLERVTTTIRQGVEDAAKGDQAAGEKAIADARTMATEWIGALRVQAAKTDNPDLRQAIDDLATKLKTVESGEASPDNVNAMVADGNKSIAGYCG